MVWKMVAAVVVLLFVLIFVAGKVSSTVQVKRTLNASLDKVWKIWTDAEDMKKWWSPKDFTAPVIKSDFRVGGTFLYAMKSPKDEMFWNTGTYKEIIPHKKIVQVMSFSDENGRIVPGPEVKLPGKWPTEVTVTIEFSEQDGKTVVTVTETGIPAVMKLFATMGWDQQFDKFDTLL